MIYGLHLLIYFDIYLIVALSLNIVVGYCGTITLAHASFFVIGAYTYALTTLNLGWGFLPAIAAAAAVAAVVSPLLSFAAWRLRGDFFVLFSLAVQTMLFSLFYNWHSPEDPIGSLTNLTNGSFGIGGIARPSIGGIGFSSVGSVAVLFTIISGVFLLLTWALLSSPWGRVLKAMRDDELATRSLGKKVRSLKVQALAIACAMAALAGAMYASYVSFIDPASGALSESILFLSMIIVGGVGNRIRGPLVGALLLLLIPEGLRFMALPDTLAVELRLLIYGLLLILLMHLRPQGIAGDYKLN
jgi:branched-chain amino acid transport system permease protein